MFHLLAIEDTEATAQLLHTYGRKMIEQGQLETLLLALRKIPNLLKDRYYMLWFYEGEIHRYRSSYEPALYGYELAERLARQQHDFASESAGLEGQAKVYLDTIQPGKADELLKKAIEVLERSPAPSNESRVKLYSLMSGNLLNLGEASKADQWFQKCLSMKPNFHAPELEARICLRTGRLELARHRSEHLPRAHRETDIILSLVYSFIGEPEKAKKFAEASIMQGVKCKAPFVEACGWMRMGHAAMNLPKYEMEMLLECYKTALEVMDGINVSRGKGESLMGLCLLYGREKFTDLAMKYGQQALHETERVKDRWLSSRIRLGMGISYANVRRWTDRGNGLPPRLYAARSDVR